MHDVQEGASHSVMISCVSLPLNLQNKPEGLVSYLSKKELEENG